MRRESPESAVVRTLAYYDLFDHPLTPKEIELLFPGSDPRSCAEALDTLRSAGTVERHNGHFTLRERGATVALRAERTEIARRRLRIARAMSWLIQQFPFVRGIFVSGDLSKGVATTGSDIDFVIVTAPGRLWICRSLLTLFKRVFLFNSRKYFCMNYLVSEDRLVHDERNYFTATEIAHLLPVYNLPMFLRYMSENRWVMEYFPHLRVFGLKDLHRIGRIGRIGRIRQNGGGVGSVLRWVLELPFRLKAADRLDRWLLGKTRHHWETAYAGVPEETRRKIFKSEITESRAYVGNFAEKILAAYESSLRRHGVS